MKKGWVEEARWKRLVLLLHSSTRDLFVCPTPSHNMPPGAVEPTSVKSVSVQIRDTDPKTGVGGPCHNISSSTTTVTNEYDFFSRNLKEMTLISDCNLKESGKVMATCLSFMNMNWLSSPYPITSLSYLTNTDDCEMDIYV